MTICLLLLPAMAAAELSPRLDSLTAAVLRNNNLPAGGTNDVTLNMVRADVNRSIDWACRTFPALRKVDTVYVDSTSDGTALPADLHRAILVMWAKTTPDGVGYLKPLRPINPDSIPFLEWIEEEMIMDPADDAPDLEYYIEGQVLGLRPQWQRRDSVMLQVTYYAIDSVLTADGSETSVLPGYIERIEHRATALVWQRRSRPDLAQTYFALSERGLPPVKKEMEGKK